MYLSYAQLTPLKNDHSFPHLVCFTFLPPPCQRTFHLHICAIPSHVNLLRPSNSEKGITLDNF